jgi:hypothetical protein
MLSSIEPLRLQNYKYKNTAKDAEKQAFEETLNAKRKASDNWNRESAADRSLF